MSHQERATARPAGMPEQGRGFRYFIMDPKSSVMNYIAENIPSGHGIQQPGNAAPSFQQSHSNTARPNDFQNQHQQPTWSQGNQQAGIAAHENTHVQSISGPQAFSSQPYIASNLLHSQHELQEPSAQNTAMPSQAPLEQPSSQTASQFANLKIGNANSFQHTPQTLYPGQNHGDGLSSEDYSFSTPSLLPMPKRPAQSAPRIYHRMIQEFEQRKCFFHTAKTENRFNDMASAAYELESLSHRLWRIRSEHAHEFESSQEIGHQICILHWQAQYELWADTVLDIQESESGSFSSNVSQHGHPAPQNGSNPFPGLQSTEYDSSNIANVSQARPLLSSQQAPQSQQAQSNNSLPQQQFVSGVQGQDLRPSSSQSISGAQNNQTQNAAAPQKPNQLPARNPLQPAPQATTNVSPMMAPTSINGHVVPPVHEPLYGSNVQQNQQVPQGRFQGQYQAPAPTSQVGSSQQAVTIQAQPVPQQQQFMNRQSSPRPGQMGSPSQNQSANNISPQPGPRVPHSLQAGGVN